MQRRRHIIVDCIVLKVTAAYIAVIQMICDRIRTGVAAVCVAVVVSIIVGGNAAVVVVVIVEDTVAIIQDAGVVIVTSVIVVAIIIECINITMIAIVCRCHNRLLIRNHELSKHRR